jgi:hypothetical protein
LSYLYALVDELRWLEKEEKNLSASIREELKKIRRYIRKEINQAEFDLLCKREGQATDTTKKKNKD